MEYFSQESPYKNTPLSLGRQCPSLNRRGPRRYRFPARRTIARERLTREPGKRDREWTKRSTKRRPINVYVCKGVSGIDITLAQAIAREPVVRGGVDAAARKEAAEKTEKKKKAKKKKKQKKKF